MRKPDIKSGYGANNPEPPAMKMPDAPEDITHDSLHAATEYLAGPYLSPTGKRQPADGPQEKRDG